MRDKITNLLDSKYFLLFIFIYATIAFLVNLTLSMAESIAFPVFVCIFSVVYCVIGLLSLIFLEDTKNAMMMAFVFPFFHGTLSNVDYVTIFALVPVSLMVIGVFIHHIIYKPKLRINKLLPGMAIFWLAICFGGIGSTSSELCDAHYQLWHTLFYILISVLIIYVMLVISSSTKITFIEFAKLLSFLSLLVAIEVFYFIVALTLIKHWKYFEWKPLDLGWGISNTVAIMLLMFIPASFYLVTKTNNKYKYFYFATAYLASAALVLTFSRMGTLVCIFELIACSVYLFKYSNNRKQDLICYGIGVALALLLVGMVIILKPDIWENIKNLVSFIHLDTFNGRRVIYSSFTEVFSQNKMFGVGLIDSFKFHIWGTDYAYTFCHETFFHMMLVSGSFGLCLFIIHMILKYYYLVKNINRDKFILLLAFLAPGLYGLIDVTYFTPVFMITLCLTYCMVDELFKEKEVEELVASAN